VVPSFRLLTYNIRKGKGASGREDGSVEGLGTALSEQGPDLLLCQEVFHGGRHAIFQSTALASRLGLQPFYAPNRTRRHAHIGNATFSRFAVTAWSNHNISTNPLERRGVLYTRMEIDGTHLHLFNAHLGLNQHQRSLQIRRIGELIDSLTAPGEPLILAGDFNDWNRRLDKVVTQTMGLTNALAHLKGRDSLTWHARRPVFCLDRIYLRNLRMRQGGRLHGAPWTSLSDHLPLWAELEPI
jgi:endonuclease/exonuclease/phosphatase family metal-dependent hydrolase